MKPWSTFCKGVCVGFVMGQEELWGQRHYLGHLLNLTSYSPDPEGPGGPGWPEGPGLPGGPIIPAGPTSPFSP